MNKSGKRIVALIVVLVVVAAGIWLLAKDKSKTESTSTNTNSNTNSNSNDETTADVTITYDGRSFKTSANAVKSGGTVRVVNDSQNDLDFDSDPHPVHTDNEELNAGEISPGKSKTFTLTTRGTWGFHNHLNSSQTGSLKVE